MKRNFMNPGRIVILAVLLLNTLSCYSYFVVRKADPNEKFADDCSEGIGVPYFLTTPRFLITEKPPTRENPKFSYELKVEHVADPKHLYAIRTDVPQLKENDFSVDLGHNSNMVQTNSTSREQFTPFVQSLGTFLGAALDTARPGSSSTSEIAPNSQNNMDKEEEVEETEKNKKELQEENPINESEQPEQNSATETQANTSNECDYSTPQTVTDLLICALKAKKEVAKSSDILPRKIPYLLENPEQIGVDAQNLPASEDLEKSLKGMGSDAMTHSYLFVHNAGDKRLLLGLYKTLHKERADQRAMSEKDRPLIKKLSKALSTLATVLQLNDRAVKYRNAGQLKLKIDRLEKELVVNPPSNEQKTAREEEISDVRESFARAIGGLEEHNLEQSLIEQRKALLEKLGTELTPRERGKSLKNLTMILTTLAGTRVALLKRYTDLRPPDPPVKKGNTLHLAPLTRYRKCEANKPCAENRESFVEEHTATSPQFLIIYEEGFHD